MFATAARRGLVEFGLPAGWARFALLLPAASMAGLASDEWTGDVDWFGFASAMVVYDD
jgi:hypothetical protein